MDGNDPPVALRAELPPVWETGRSAQVASNASTADPDRPDGNRALTSVTPGTPPGHRSIGPVDVALDLVGTTVTAVDLVVRPGDDRLYIAEQGGRIARLDPAGGVEPEIVLDIGFLIGVHVLEQGLTGFEFSADGRHAWVHTTTSAGATSIAEYAVNEDGVFDPESRRVMIDVGGPPAEHHNSGDMVLADDGTLLITLGDGGAGPGLQDPHEVGPDPSQLRGSILRVRPTPGAPTTHEIPADNPFAPGGPALADDPDGRPEVLAWGVRNPWKIDIDPLTGTLWFGDVGNNFFEEVNVAEADDGFPGSGLDFGWSRREGPVAQRDDLLPVGDVEVEPFYAYPHEGVRCAIAGGVVYRGDAIPDLLSAYVFADVCEGTVWALDAVSGEAHRIIGDEGGGNQAETITAVRRGPDGELYVLTLLGDVYRIVAT